MAKQGTVDTQNLTKPQLQFAIDVMAMVMDKLIQDDMLLNEDGTPKPVVEQDELIQKAMKLLNYK